MKRKIYFFALIGAAAGLIAAALHQALLLGIFARQAALLDRRVYDVLLGLVIGAPIGFLPSFMEGRSHSSISGALRSGLIGGLLGAVGGMLSVPMSEILHNQLGGGILGRSCAMGLLGMTVGIGVGANVGSRWWRGVAGGLAGGLFAGALLEVLLESHVAYSDAAIIALIILGLSTSMFVSLFLNVLTEAWLEGLPGSKIAGQIYQLGRFFEPNEAILGSDKKGPVFIWIPGADPHHTSITLTRKGARLRHAAKEGTTLVNGSHTSECFLKNGDIIQIASSRLCFRERRAAVASPKIRFPEMSGDRDGKGPQGQSKPGRSVVIKTVSLVLAILLRASAIAASDAAVSITQVELLPHSKVRIYVSIADSQGNPLPDSDRAKLEIYEAGNLVASQSVSQGWSVSSVLVLDLSGSMKGDKLRQAKAAMQRYIDLAPPAYHIALVGFSDQPSLISGLDTNKNDLSTKLAPLQASGNTALQDAVAFALSLLKGEGRHSVLLLTDGRENKSARFQGAAGERAVIQAAREGSVTISVVGLGSDVDRDYLKKFESTGGTYFEAPTPSQLTGLFENAMGRISKERMIEYDSQLSSDGLREKLLARLVWSEPGQSEKSVDAARQVITPGFIPDVKGNLIPYSAGLLFLFAWPWVWSFCQATASVQRFRATQLQRLPVGSEFIGKCDPNGAELFVSSPVVTCPGCSRLHTVRSWRHGRCACMLEPLGRGPICLQRFLPMWLRYSLDKLTGGRTTAEGRAWLCHCAGDKEGY